MKITLLFILTLSSLSCLAQTYSQKDFEAIQLPQDRSTEWYKLDTSLDKAFSVAIINNKLVVRADTESVGKIYTLPEGRLMALDMGEWVGGLTYKPNDSTLRYFYVNDKPDTLNNKYFNLKMFISKKDRILNYFKGKQLRIIFGDIHQVFFYKDDVLLVEEVNDLEKDRGAILNLSINKDIVKYTVMTEINDAPHAIATYRYTIFVATLRGFYIVDNWKAKPIFESLSWYGLNPNSVAILDKEHVYVGMHCGYAMIDLSKKSLVFYKHKYNSN
jgi:hypothetical protein